MKKFLSIVAVVLAAALTLSGCTQQSAASRQRDEQQSQNKVDSLEIKNLKEKRDREENPVAIRYVYLINYGTIFGYYVAEGKISSSSSQIAPEQDLIKGWEAPGEGEELYVVDSAKDDGSHGPGDPGIFFFTADGVMVETSLDYITSDAPLPLDVPRLGGKVK